MVLKLIFDAKEVAVPVLQTPSSEGICGFLLAGSCDAIADAGIVSDGLALLSSIRSW